MYNFLYFTLLVFKLWQKQISQKLQNREGGTIFKRLVAKPRSRGQALGGVQKADPREGFRPKSAFLAPLFFSRGFF